MVFYPLFVNSAQWPGSRDSNHSDAYRERARETERETETETETERIRVKRVTKRYSGYSDTESLTHTIL